MKEPIPLHRHDYLSDKGFSIKIVTQTEAIHHPVLYAHRDDFYIFGIIVRGSLCCDIDFNTQSISEGEIQFIRPGQIHRFISGNDFEGWMIMLEEGLVDDKYKLVFEEASVNGIPNKMIDIEFDEIKTLFTLIRRTVERNSDMTVVRHLISAFVGMIAECFQRSFCQRSEYNSRHTDIVIKLNSLLQTHLTESHRPSFYADKLHLSTVYLNEVVKNVTGWNASNYIRNEIVLRAKRMLYHTDMSVKEISVALGFEDSAYFTRVFTKTTGRSPMNFKLKP